MTSNSVMISTNVFFSNCSKHLFHCKSQCWSNHALDALLEISLERPMVAGNDAKIIKCLKGMKSQDIFTDEQEAIIDRLISCWENGEIPAKVSKDVAKAIKLASDIMALYYEIVRLVPETYLEEKQEKKSVVEGKKEIILSCFLKGDNK